MRVIVTRPEAQALPFVERLRALGVDAVAQPLIGIEPPADPGAVRAAWQRLGEAALAMFVSANAVAYFFEARPEQAGWPPATLAGSTGPGTSAALRRQGVPDALLREPAPDSPRLDTEALWQQLRDEPWDGQRVLVVRGEGGRDWLAQTLRAQGATVDFLVAYRRAGPQPDAAQQAWLDDAVGEPARSCWLFSSSEAVQQLPALVPGADWSSAPALATHPRIAEAAQAVGFARVQVVAPGWPPLLQALSALPGQGQAA